MWCALSRKYSRNEEREVNMQTFGVSSVNRGYGYRRRGRGRGGYRGRGRSDIVIIGGAAAGREGEGEWLGQIIIGGAGGI